MARPPQPRRRPDRGYWYAEVGGVRVKLADRTATKDEAWKALHAFLADRGRGPKASSITVVRLASKFLEWTEREREQSTLEWYGQRLRSFCELFGETPAAEIQPLDVTRWLAAHPDWAEGNRFNAVTALKRLYRWGKRQGHLTVNPLAEMEKPTPGRRDVILTDAQCREIMAAIPDQPFRDLLMALWESGARPGELFSLTADRIDLTPGAECWIVTNKTRRKTREKTRAVMLSPGLIVMSRRLLAEHPTGLVFRNTKGTAWTRHTVAHRFERLRKQLGMGPEATAYSLRHVYITDALERGEPIATVAELVGHTDTTMISRVYSKLSERRKYLSESAKRIRPGGVSTEDGPPGD
jgi:integrase